VYSLTDRSVISVLNKFDLHKRLLRILENGIEFIRKLARPRSAIDNTKAEGQEVTHRPGTRYWSWWTLRSLRCYRCDANREPSGWDWTATRRRASCRVLRRASGSSVLQVTFANRSAGRRRRATSCSGEHRFVTVTNNSTSLGRKRNVREGSWIHAAKNGVCPRLRKKNIIRNNHNHHLSIFLIFNISFAFVTPSGVATCRPSATKPSTTRDPSSNFVALGVFARITKIRNTARTRRFSFVPDVTDARLARLLHEYIQVTMM